MKKTRFDNLGNIGYDILTLFVGISFLLQNYSGWLFMYIMVVLTSFYLGIKHSVIFYNKKNGKTDILLAVFAFGFAIALLSHPALFTRFSILFVGWWIFINGCFSLIRFHVKINDQVEGAACLFFSGALSLLLALFLLLSNSLVKESILSFIAGIYFIVYGVLGLSFHLIVTSSWSTKQSRKNWSFSLPILLNAFLPMNVYISIQKLKEKSKLDIPQNVVKTDLHVYIYLKNKGTESFGHIDIGYKGTVYSYGCHDPFSRKLFGTYGDGVLIKSDENAFIQSATNGEHKTIISYGIALNKDEEKALEKRIANLLSRTTVWLCPYAKRKLEEINDYASRVYKRTKCTMYKFTKGKFKTYFIAGTNCVNLADDLLRCDELNLIDLNGLVTPGAYLAFLNTEYLKKNSIVTSRTLFEPSC